MTAHCGLNRWGAAWERTRSPKPTAMCLWGSIPHPPADKDGSADQRSGRLPVKEKIGGSNPLGTAARKGVLEVWPTPARHPPLKRDHVGSTPTASTDCVRGVAANTPPCHGGNAGATPAGCSVTTAPMM